MSGFGKHLQAIALLFFIFFCASTYPEWSSGPLVTFSTLSHDTNHTHLDSGKTHTDFSYHPNYPVYKDHALSLRTSNFKLYTISDFQRYFSDRRYTSLEVLDERFLYMLDEFVKYAQTYSGYNDAIQKLYAELKNLSLFQKTYRLANGTYCKGLQDRIRYLYNQLDAVKEISYDPNFIAVNHDFFSQQFAEYKSLQSVYKSYTPLLADAIDERLKAYDSIVESGLISCSGNKVYDVVGNIKQILLRYGHRAKDFTQCSGNQLQQVIHQESLDILDRIDCLPSSSVLYDHQEALVGFAAAMVDYNHANMSDKAMRIGDLCWTLLDYGQAIAEGIALGAYSAAHDILTNPIQATISIVAGKQILAFQLCKVFYNVAEIGATAITNFDHAKEKWNKYTEPLNNLIDAISKKEIAVRDSIKNGTAFVVGYKAQGKLLGGLGKLCNTIKHKTINFVKNNSLVHPHEYLTTPEGLLFKATGQFDRLGQATPSKLKNGVDDKVFRHKSIKGLLKKEGLPTKGKLRYVPPKKLHVAGKLPEVVWHDRRKGFVDRFGNVWLKGKSRTKGQPHEWDVQLSKQGIQQVGWMTRDNSHLNVSLDGRVTHK